MPEPRGDGLGAGDDLVAVRARGPAVLEHHPPVDHRGVDVGADPAVDDHADAVNDRPEVRRLRVEEEQVGLEAGRERPDFALEQLVGAEPGQQIRLLGGEQVP